MTHQGIPDTFIQHAAEIIGSGLRGAEIIRATAKYAVEFGVDVPHSTYPFDASKASNKRAALCQNIRAFTPSQQYRIIRELADHESFQTETAERKELKFLLVSRYSHLAPDDAPSEVNETLIEETRHWLEDYPEALSLYSQALEKYHHGAFYRNLLDDLRLALEKLLRQLFTNNKSLENQIRNVGQFINEKGGSSQLSNMFVKLLDYYTKYHNSYIKHDDAVKEQEIEFVLEITSSFMKHLVRLHRD